MSGVVFLRVLLLTASVIATTASGANSADPVNESISGSEFVGGAWCLGKGSIFRERIREVAESKWAAVDTTETAGANSTCDVGPIAVERPNRADPCALVPYIDVFHDGDRVEINGAASPWLVTFKSGKGERLSGFPAEFRMIKNVNPATEKIRWLYTDVPITWSSGSDVRHFFVYIYIADNNSKTDIIEKNYRIELFDADNDKCANTRPDQRGMAWPTEAAIFCRTNDQEPVGEGRQRKASAITASKYKCDYTPFIKRNK